MYGSIRVVFDLEDPFVYDDFAVCGKVNELPRVIGEVSLEFSVNTELLFSSIWPIYCFLICEGLCFGMGEIGSIFWWPFVIVLMKMDLIRRLAFSYRSTRYSSGCNSLFIGLA